MQTLASSTGTSVGLCARDRLDMIYVEFCAPTDETILRHDIGDKMPIAQNAAGRAYLAAMPEEERDYFLSHIEAETAENWPKVKNDVKEAIERYQLKGYCYSFGDWEPDINGIAVPLRLGQGNIFSFNAGGSAYRITPEFLKNEVLPPLKNMVREIEALLMQR